MGTKNVTVGVSVVSNRASTSRKNSVANTLMTNISTIGIVGYLKDSPVIVVVKVEVVIGIERVPERGVATTIFATIDRAL